MNGRKAHFHGLEGVVLRVKAKLDTIDARHDSSPILGVDGLEASDLIRQRSDNWVGVLYFFEGVFFNVFMDTSNV